MLKARVKEKARERIKVIPLSLKILNLLLKEVGHWKRNCPAYLAELIKKKKQVGTTSSSGKMTRKPFPHRTERVTGLLGLIHTDACGPLTHVSIQVFETFKVFKNEVENQLRKTIKALRSDHRGGKYISQEFKDYLKACGIVQQLTPPYKPQHNGVSERRNHTAARILNMVPTKKVDKTPYELWYGKCPNLSYLRIWGYEDTSPSENTNEIPMEVEGFEPPQEEVVPVHKSARTHRALDLLCLNVKVDEHKMQSKKDNQVWCLVDLPPNSRLVGKGYTQTYGVDYDETFSPVTDIRAIRILIAIATFYDYEIWQIDVKTAFLNGYLDEDIYMVQSKGFVDPNHPRKVCKLQRSIYGLKQA
ncbi:retrotransposon protein, putative, ty1-copia subclass [Tanacetum coccineum]